ncbi:efflux transporter outer membrane subunit [Castellaniella ginsengisoli]|uniref:Efflux transporter outer membrane subunit n=1 Tax=Castellaniella ginsengisoli TaxID=546114 RepID=A0AB39E9D2_9BURK
MNGWRIAGAAVLGLGLAGCAPGPSGQAPVMPEPARYAAGPPPDGGASAAGPELVRAHAPAAAWWARFGAPELDALVAEAWAANPDLAAARQRLEAAREVLRAQTGATTLPSIDLGAQAARQRALGLPLTLPPPLPELPRTSIYDTFVGQAQVRYAFDLFGSIRERNRALADRVEQQSAQWRAAREALAANVVSGALTLSALQARLDILASVAAGLRRDEAEAARRQALGAAARAAVLDARRQAEAMAAQIPGLQAQALSIRHALAVLLGRTPDQAPEAIAFERLALPAQIPVLVPAALLAARPDIQAAAAALRAAAHDAGAASADRLPGLTLTAAMGRGGYDWSSALSPAGALWSLAGGLTAPLFHGGALQARHRASLQAHAAAQDDYRSTVLAAFREVADALASLEQGGAAQAAGEAAARAARAAAADAARRAALGAVPPAAARAAGRQADLTALDALDVRAQRLLDAARLFHALGAPAPDGA